jgi:peptide/nickel transport system permease protein
MQRYLIRRFLQLIPTLLLASIFIFAIISLAPGDPAQMMLGSEATQEDLRLERIRLGLDKPLPVRYGIWLSNIVHLQFGFSLYTDLPVTQLLARAFPNTVRLALTSLALSVLLGIPLGMLAALKQDSPTDAFVTGFNALGLAIPSFWLGIMLIIVFAVQLKVLPPSGAGDPDKSGIYNLRYLIMPVMTIALSNLSVFSRFTRSAMIDVLSADYIRTAYAKGLHTRTVISRHALKNALIPVTAIFAIQFGRLLGGAVVTEVVFSYPGVGRLVISSILNRDYPVVQATLILVVSIFLVTNVAVDIVYAYLDPRIKLGESQA